MAPAFGEKLKAAVKAKIQELGVEVDNDLLEYVFVLSANRKDKAQMKKDLHLFLGKNTGCFVDWLFAAFERIQASLAELQKKKAEERAKPTVARAVEFHLGIKPTSKGDSKHSDKSASSKHDTEKRSSRHDRDKKSSKHDTEKPSKSTKRDTDKRTDDKDKHSSKRESEAAREPDPKRDSEKRSSKPASNHKDRHEKESSEGKRHKKKRHSKSPGSPKPPHSSDRRPNSRHDRSRSPVSTKRKEKHKHRDGHSEEARLEKNLEIEDTAHRRQKRTSEGDSQNSNASASKQKRPRIRPPSPVLNNLPSTTAKNDSRHDSKPHHHDTKQQITKRTYIEDKHRAQTTLTLSDSGGNKTESRSRVDSTPPSDPPQASKPSSSGKRRSTNSHTESKPSPQPANGISGKSKETTSRISKQDSVDDRSKTRSADSTPAPLTDAWDGKIMIDDESSDDDAEAQIDELLDSVHELLATIPETEVLSGATNLSAHLFQHQQLPSPTTSATPSVSSNTQPAQKIMERCRFWPNCEKGDSCGFHHPTKVCTTFPTCSFGNKCLYIHPLCRYNQRCKRSDCPYTHDLKGVATIVAYPHDVAGAMASQKPTAMSSSIPGIMLCQRRNCADPQCQYQHPPPCKYGLACRKPNCAFTHKKPDLSKFQWKSSG